ncbi:hypothetical protein Q3G72_028712 [Acer saccharum]|nr:hypothetical protein Q3G72_028712 [Acer saccharum]
MLKVINHQLDCSIERYSEPHSQNLKDSNHSSQTTSHRLTGSPPSLAHRHRLTSHHFNTLFSHGPHTGINNHFVNNLSDGMELWQLEVERK